MLRVGIVTDTHVGKTDASCARVRLAYQLFRDLGVDLVHNNGDVADAHYPTGYAAYRRMMDEVFADVPAAHLGRRSDCRVTVTPEGFFGTVGRPIVAYFSTEG